MRNLARALAAAALLAWVGSVALAETIYLKSGSKISGKIIESDDKKVKIEVATDEGKAVMTIDRARIDRIEEATTFEERLKAAATLLENGQNAQAETEFRDLVRNEPRSAQARMGLAKALVANFKYEEAIKTLEHYLLLVDTNRSADLMMYLAEQYLQARNYRDAKRTAREAAALYPQDRQLATAADEFEKRCDRVKAGTEQLKERETAESAERKRRRDERAAFDKKAGNCFEATRAAKELAAWASESQPGLVLSYYHTISAPDDAWQNYNLGGDEQALQAQVHKSEIKLIVDEATWLGLYDHQKSVMVNGWYYQLKGLYPKSFPVIEVFCLEPDPKAGKDATKEKKLAKGSWDGRQEEVTVDRTTKENRDPMRPRKVIR